MIRPSLSSDQIENLGNVSAEPSEHARVRLREEQRAADWGIRLVRGVPDRSKYMPHIGKKQIAKGRRRLERAVEAEGESV
jgi:hypothetical protein